MFLEQANSVIDVVIINPGASRTIYQGLSEDLSAIEPPAWCRMIAGWLIDRGVSVAILDQDAFRWTPEEVAEQVKKLNPRLVAIVVSGQQPSASTQQMTGASLLAKAIQGVPKIMVGNHPSALPVRTLTEEDVDYVCDGEGPLTIAGILNGDPLSEIPGLVWHDSSLYREADDHSIVMNTLAPLLPIDELHGDVWDMLPMGQYRAHTWQCLDGSPRSPYASIYTTLGCPFKCSFCMINVFQHSNTYRRRTPEKVVEQVKHLYQVYGVKTLKIADEMFVLDPSHYLPICEGLAALPFAEELNIWAYARIDTVKPETLSLMRRAGIRWLALGIESGSTHVRDGAEKSLDDNDIKETVKAIQDAGINVIGNFIFGLPDDTLESMQATLGLAKGLNCEFANFYSAMAYPGSRLFDEADTKDLPASWDGYSQHSYTCRPLPTAQLSSADVLEFRDNAFHEYFSNAEYLDSIALKFGRRTVRHIVKMASHRLPRQLIERTALDFIHADGKQNTARTG